MVKNKLVLSQNGTCYYSKQRHEEARRIAEDKKYNKSKLPQNILKD
jgi:hypothetical protein